MPDIIPFAATGVMAVPAHVAALFDADSNIAPRVTINQLSYKGKVWRRIVDGEEIKITRKNADGDSEPVPIVGLVVLDHNKGRSRAYYEGDFVEGENKAPRCASMDGIKPDAGIAEPIAATCASCPNAVKGSKITESGKQTTLCAANKRIAVVPVTAIGTHPVLLLRIAQTSVWDKNNPHEAQGWYAWDQYLDLLRARGAKNTAAVETRVKFDMDKAYPKLLFSAARWLNEDEAKAAKQRRIDADDEVAKILTGGGDDGVAGQPGIPAEGVEQPGGAAQADGAAAAAAAQAAADAAAKVEADKAAKAAADKAAKAAAKKVKEEAAAKAAAAAQAAADAAAAAAAAAAQADDGDWGGGDDTPSAPAAAPAPAAQAAPAAAAAATVVTEVPAGLAELMNGWDA